MSMPSGGLALAVRWPSISSYQSMRDFQAHLVAVVDTARAMMAADFIIST